MPRSTALAALLVVLLTTSASSAFAPVQPGRPDFGYGSGAGYVSKRADVFQSGDIALGTAVTWYVPEGLRRPAPTVVFLHGFGAPFPVLYQGHIDHLTRQGYVVIFPQFQVLGAGFLQDTDQNLMLARAVASVDRALSRLDWRVDRSRVYLYGHSLGGLLAASWASAGGVEPAGVVLANPSLGGGLPDFVRQWVDITPINIRHAAGFTRAPVVILAGAADTLAPTGESRELFAYLRNSSRRILYEAQSDDHGWPSLAADHIAPLSIFGIEDALDFRYYQAVLDAVIAGRFDWTPRMGRWSDGVNVREPRLIFSVP